jgi:hypothetical protein
VSADFCAAHRLGPKAPPAPLARTTDGLCGVTFRDFFAALGRCSEETTSMTEPASHTLAYLGRLGRIEDELLVLNGIVLRLEGREVETAGLRQFSIGAAAA